MGNLANGSPSCKDREDRPPPPSEEFLAAVRETVKDAVYEAVREAHLADAPKCISKAAAAERLDISLRKLDTIIQAGEIKSIKSGRRRLIPLRALRRYVERKLDGGPQT